MARNNDINIDIRARNQTKQGLLSSKNAIRRFATDAQNMVANIAAPAAVVTAAIMLLKKAFEAVSDAINAAGKRARENFAGNLDARLNSLQESIRLVNTRFEQLETAAKSANTVLRASIDTTRKLDDANRQLVKAGLLSTAANSEQAKAIEEAYNRETELKQAANDVADAKQQQTNLIDEAARAQKKAADLAQLEANAQHEAARASAQAMRYNRQAQSKWSIASGQSQTLIDDAKQARQSAQQFTLQAIKLAEQRMKAEQEAAEKTALARIAADDITATSRQQLATIARQQAEAEIQRLDKVAEAQEKLAKAQEQLEKEQQQRREEGLRDIIRQQKEQAQAAQNRAKGTIQAFLDEMNAEKIAKEQEEKHLKRIEKLKAKEARGVKLSRRDREFMQAIEKREQELGAAAGARFMAQDAQAKLDLAELKKQNDKLEALNRTAQDAQANLDQLAKPQDQIKEMRLLTRETKRGNDLMQQLLRMG